MKFDEFNNKLEEFDYFVSIKNTGTTPEFAKKLGVCERSIGYLLEFLRDRGAQIGFDRFRRSYYYKNRITIQFFKLKVENTDKIKGGENLFNFFSSLQDSCRLADNLCAKLKDEEKQSGAGSFRFFGF